MPEEGIKRRGDKVKVRVLQNSNIQGAYRRKRNQKTEKVKEVELQE